MKRALGIVWFLVLSAPSVRAIELRLKDTQGIPLAFAQVRVTGRPGTAIADREGRVEIVPDPVPPFEVLVSSADGVLLSPVEVSSLPSAGALELLIPRGLDESVEVLGATSDAIVPPGAALTVLGRSDLELRLPERLAQALETIPGAGRIEEGTSMVPSIRGLARSRTLLVLDGGRVSAERRAGASASFLDPETIDEVEVVRGPGSVAYGSEAFGGVIRAQTALAAPGDPGHLRYGSQYATAGDERAASVAWGGGVGAGALTLGAHGRATEDYESPEGEVFNSAAKLWGFRAGWQAEAGPGLVSALWRTDLGRDVGKPALDSRATRAYYPEESSNRLSLGYRAPGPGRWSRLGGTLTWDRYRLVTVRDRQPDPAAGVTRRIRSSDLEADDLGIRFEAERSAGTAHLITGADFSSRIGLSALDGEVSFDLAGNETQAMTTVAIDDARRIDLGLFAQGTGTVKRLTWGLGLRGDRVSSRNRGGIVSDREFSKGAFSGFASSTVRLGAGLDGTAQYSRGFREPVLSDRFFVGVTGRGTIYGNPDLTFETSDQFDVALRWTRGRTRAAAYAYRYEIDRYIERIQISGTNDFTFVNRPCARIEGGEIEAAVEIARGIELSLGLQQARGDLVEDGAPLADVPAPALLGNVRQRVGTRWWWMIRGAAYGRDDRPGPTEAVVPGYGVIDVAVGVRVRETLEVQILGRNLADRAYPDSADALAALAPGRSITISLRGRFEPARR